MYRPQLQRKSPLPGPHSDLSLCISRILRQDAQKMMSLICLSAHCCYNTNTAETGNIINQLTQIRLARMSAAVRPDSQQNDHRHPGFLCLLNAVAYACHNIILLICRDICRRSIKLPQILLTWLQLDNTQRCIRCCPRKIF